MTRRFRIFTTTAITHLPMTALAATAALGAPADAAAADWGAVARGDTDAGDLLMALATSGVVEGLCLLLVLLLGLTVGAQLLGSRS